MSSALDLLLSAKSALEKEAAAVAVEKAAVAKLVAEHRKALAAEHAEADARRAAAAALLRGGEVLTLNVGGRLITTLRGRLAQAQHSLLAELFSGRCSKSQLRDADGNCFLDDDPDDFAAVLRALRYHQPPRATAGLVALADKYRLREALWPQPFVGGTVVSLRHEQEPLLSVAREGRTWRLKCAAGDNDGGDGGMPVSPPRSSFATALASPATSAAGSPDAVFTLGMTGRLPLHEHAFFDAALPSARGTHTWCVVLRALSPGALLGVATNSADVHGIVMCGALLPFAVGHDARSVQRAAPELAASYAAPVLQREMVSVSAASAPKQRPFYGRMRPELASGLCGLRVNHVLRFVLSDATDGPHRLLSITALEADLEAHASSGMQAAAAEHGAAPRAPDLVLQLPAPRRVAAAAGSDSDDNGGDAPPPWRFYVQLGAGDEVVVRHEVDVAFPAQR
jgi:hypothetical protein